jgi:phosphate transport system substrate-binding protein
VELVYATQNKLSVAQLQNSSGNFVAPTAASATAAAEAAVAKLPANSDYRISIVNSGGADTYPITSFTWLLVYEKMSDPAKAKKLADFIRFGLTEGQKDAPALDYAPLPASLVSRLTARLDSIAGGSGK